MLLLSTVIKAVALLSYLYLALLTVRSSSPPKVRRFFSIYLIVMIYWQFVSLMLNISKTPGTAVFWYNLLIPGTGLHSVLFFLLTRSFLGFKGQKPLTYLAYGTSAFLIIISILGIPISEVRMGNGGIYVPEIPSVVYLIGAVGYSFWFIGVFNLMREVAKTRSSFQRNRVMYLLLGSGFVILGTASNFTPLQDYPIDIAFNLINTCLIGFAVIRYRLVDIRVFLTKGLFYSIFAGLLVGLYLGCDLLVESTGKRFIGYDSPWFGMTAVLMLAIVFLPLRDRIQMIIDRFFFKEKYDYQTAVEGFSKAVASKRNPDELTNLVARAVSDTIHASKVFILLQDEDQVNFSVHTYWGASENQQQKFQFKITDALVEWMRREKRPVVIEEMRENSQISNLLTVHEKAFDELGLSVLAPILLKNRLTGILCLGRKLSGTMYTDQDVRFLTTLSSQAATAIDNTVAHMDVERRLSEQTLLFILSETFRRSLNIEDVIHEAIGILRTFLKIDICGILYIERQGSFRVFSDDPLSNRAMKIATGIRLELSEYYMAEKDAGFAVPELYQSAIQLDPELPQRAKKKLFECACLPLRQRTDLFGMLLISRSGRDDASDLRTIGAIVTQGIMMQRTVVNLVSVKSYNEKILNSLNDMGDTLIILDLDRTIKSANRATCDLLGFNQDELAHRDISLITRLDEELFSAGGFAHLIKQGTITNYELTYRHKNGEEIPMLFSGSLLTNKDGEAEAVVAMARDITEHKRAEEVQKNLLLIREIHHRIKNNLQVISSLLYLQSGYVSDDKTREMFIESQNRVRSMALIHENLYQSDDMAGIGFADYLRNLTHSLMVTYATGEDTIHLDIDIEERLILGMDTAIPCGLIINELVTNSLKYAFKGVSDGSERFIKVDLRSSGAKPSEGFAKKKTREFSLTVLDNGVGLPADFDIDQTDTLGLRLVTTLAKQLDGQVKLTSDGGAKFTIEFTEA